MRSLKSRNRDGPTFTIMEPRVVSLPSRYEIPTKYGVLVLEWDTKFTSVVEYTGLLITPDYTIFGYIRVQEPDGTVSGYVSVDDKHMMALAELQRGLGYTGRCLTEEMNVRMIERNPGILIEQMVSAVDKAVERSGSGKYDRHYDEYDDAGLRSDFYRDNNRLPMIRRARR